MVAPAEFYNMTMVYDGDLILVLDRKKKSWPGYTFPGGHVEFGESFTDAAIREVYEETGLTVKNLEPCGVINWAAKDGRRCVEYLYRTSDYSGELSEGTSEGKCVFMRRDELKNAEPCRLSQNILHYLPLFFGEGYSELYFEWDGEAWDGIPQYYRYEK